MMRTTLVVPCYNEEARLPAGAFKDFAARSPDVRFIFVDDGSTDRTAHLLEELRLSRPDAFQLCRLPRNQGKAEAVRQGVLAALASGPHAVGYWDADLSTPLRALEDLQRVLQDKPALQGVFSARVKLLGRGIERKILRHVAGRTFATLAGFLLDLPIYDSQCGAKLFRATPAVRQAFAAPFLSRWLFDLEIVGRLKRALGLPLEDFLCEFPLDQWRHVSGSKLSVLDAFDVFRDLLRVRHAYFRRV